MQSKGKSKSKKHVRFSINNTLKKTSSKQSSNKSALFENFKRQITLIFFEILLMVKLYHWKTYSYATHKATDELYSHLNENIDKFIEVLLGKTADSGRIKMKSGSSIPLFDLDNPKELSLKLNKFKTYLEVLGENPGLKSINMDNADLFTIRDEILADLNQFLYLLTLHN